MCTVSRIRGLHKVILSKKRQSLFISNSSGVNSRKSDHQIRDNRVKMFDCKLIPCTWLKEQPSEGLSNPPHSEKKFFLFLKKIVINRPFQDIVFSTPPLRPGWYN